MVKITELFKENEGMTADGSTVEERHEIWELLFEKKLIYDPAGNIDREHLCLGNFEFYFCDQDNLFVIGYLPCCENNIPFEDFKNRLLQLND